MQTITRTYQVYTYDELSEKAKEKVKEWYIDDPTRTDIFTEDIDYFLQENFSDSDLKVQYSLAYCQGDGLNIYGKLYCRDMLDKINWDNFTEKQQKFIKWAITEICPYAYGVIPSNRHYCYCIAENADFTGDISEELENLRMRDIDYNALDKWEKACIAYFEELCGKFEREGYEYFYNPSEEEISDCCEANEYTFTEDGKFFAL